MRVPGVRALVSPVMEIVPAGEVPDLTGVASVILTSANALEHAPDLSEKRLYCVGSRTEEALRRAGLTPEMTAVDANTLVAALLADPPPMPVLHLGGLHQRGDVAQRLNAAGITARRVVVYEQVARPLTHRAKAALEGETETVLPLYSPRTARLAGAALEHPGSGLKALAISPAAAEAWRAETGLQAQVAAAPTGEAMLDLIVAALR